MIQQQFLISEDELHRIEVQCKSNLHIFDNVRSRLVSIEPKFHYEMMLDELKILKDIAAWGEKFGDEMIPGYIQARITHIEREIEPKKQKRKRHDCYNCGMLSCEYRMIDGTGITTKDAVERRKEVHNGKKCNRWTENY